MKEPDIRPAKVKDKEAIQRIYNSMIGPPPGQEEVWDRLIRDGGLLVASVDGQIIGFGRIDVDAVEQVKWLYLLPEFQGVGVGSKILERLEKIGWEAGLTALRLHSAPQAVEFYSRHGYRMVQDSQKLGHDHEGVEMIKARGYEADRVTGDR